MKNSLSQSNSYLQALEQKERKRRKTKLFLLGAVGILAVSSAVVVPKFLSKPAATAEQSTKFRSFYATELTDDKVRAFFTGGNNQMVIRYPGEDRRDTVASYNEYASLISKSTDWQFNVVSNGDLFTDENIEDFSASPVDDALQAALGNDGESTPAETVANDANEVSNDFGFRVRGERNIGQNLNIQVLNFRSGIKYEMDFGDGRREEVSRTANVKYDEPGVYVITLRASGEGVPRRIYATYPITIEDPNAIQIEEPIASNEPTENTNTEAENTAPTLNDLAAANTDESEAVETPTEESTETAEPPAATENATTAANNASPANNNINTQQIFAASKMPEFPGGNRGLSRYIQRNLRYPRVSAANQKEGKVTVRFTVDANGRATSPYIVKGLGDPYDAEVIRIINAMPKWEPGEQNGDPVPVSKYLRISFDIGG